MYSQYGNLPFLGLLDSSYLSTKTFLSANLTLSTNAGNGTLYECSNQGTCDYTTGKCLCLFSQTSGQVQYRAISSDGKGNLGNKGDCGFIQKSVPSCYVAGEQVCNGHGFCSNTTHYCECYDGWSGMTCSIRSCPKGRAFADEPLSSEVAHQLSECSNMGVCDRANGLCKCSDGFSGPACEIKDCVRDSTTGEACSGHGSCISINRFYKTYGLSYGDPVSGYLYGGSSTWDAYNWYECVCSAKLSAGYNADVYRPSVGPASLISGTSSNSVPLPGWGNWDCSLRNCPKGDTVNRRTYRLNHLYHTNNLEIQRVYCRYSGANQTGFFTLQIFGQQTQKIFFDYTYSQVLLSNCFIIIL